MEDEVILLSAVTKLADSLTRENVKKIVSFLNPPAGLFQNVHNGVNLLDSLFDWNERNPDEILQAIESVRPDLMSTVRKIHWLINAPSELDPLNPIQTLIQILKTEIETEQWIRIGLSIPAIRKESQVEGKLRILATEGHITSNLHKLIDLMHAVNRNDIAITLQQQQHSFREMSNEWFIKLFLKEVATIEKNLKEGRDCLRRYIVTLNKNIKQVLDDKEDVDIESVYIPLTIIKDEPREVKLEDETTYNEIKLLRKIANKEIEIDPVDFAEELMQYDATCPQIWCLIGNPGSGKTFLCHRTAIRFGTNELSQFSYCVTIPCRHQEWHQMEESREKAGLSVNGDFIQEWLSLSMPIGPSWTKQLSKHILETDGHQLLIIIDSLDEFTQQVQFQNTLLFLLLNRRCLTQSTIILTSRPGAYTSISSSHDFKIDRFYQVLGFSPQNRDIYFISQLRKEAQLKQLKELFHLHEELKQLTLVPVNASLFASLIRGSDSVHAQTLTYLYSELITYLIRRQLSRMNLTELAKKTTLFNLPPNVLECLFEVGELAYFGVSTRQLTSSKDILLKVGKREKRCQCLGLAQEYFKRDEEGVIIRVWSFAHLTIQEFVGAVWLKMSSFGDQCLSTRYIVHSDEYFAIFKMVIRFVCGLLLDNSRHVLHVLYKYLPPTPITMDQMPKISQFKMDPGIVTDYMGWKMFTQNFLQLSEMLLESNLHSISSVFSGLVKHLPQNLYFYLSATSPNEWHCFLRSLRLLHSIQLIHFNTEHVTPTQFRSLLTELSSTSLAYLAVELELYMQNISKLYPYTEIINEIQLPSATKISLELGAKFFSSFDKFDFSSDIVSTHIFQLFSSLSLYSAKLPPEFLQQIANQLIHTDLLLLDTYNSNQFETLFPHLYTATQLTALHLIKIPDKYKQQLRNLLPQLTNLQEITLVSEYSESEYYSLLPHLSSYSCIKYLNVGCDSMSIRTRNRAETVEGDNLLQILNSSKQHLRVLRLARLCLTEQKRADQFLTSLHHCTNLVQITLYDTTLEPEDITLWSVAVSRMRLLVDLALIEVSIQDSGMLHLCSGLLRHPNIQYIEVEGEDLSSDSCIPLIHLIPTLLPIKILRISGSLSKPNPEYLERLEQIANLYSVKFITPDSESNAESDSEFNAESDSDLESD